MRALTPPMLIHDYALEKAVVTSSVARAMLKGLSQAGVTGVAIEPGFLRYPISTEANGPLLAPASWAGDRIYVVKSKWAAASVSALGATAVQSSLTERDKDLDNGSLLGYENSVSFETDSQNITHPYITANVALWPRSTALFANTKKYAALSDQQRKWMQEAAARTQKRVDDLAALETKAIPTACSHGTHFVTADDSVLNDLTKAFAPVYAQLE